MTFKNDAEYHKSDREDHDRYANYRHTRPSKYLFVWSRLFQTAVSQALTWKFTSKFHDREPGIYKFEGGCNIADVGELVLHSSGVSWDSFWGGREKNLTLKDSLAVAAEAIAQMTVFFDPEDPINSLIDTAANAVGCSAEELKEAVGKTRGGAVFSGNALCDFFDWNPFTTPPVDRPYLRYVLKRFGDQSDKEIDQRFADEDLGDSLLERMKARAKELSGSHYGPSPLCCSPSRTRGVLRFWVNTGTFSQIDGWKTQEELEAWMASGTKLLRNFKSR